ncbi:circularly permuted type 2 ATP-grasp protein [Roseitranquillus sediminis]|uniref:circularly permuted type 2 ATP-grasp protein n=1 Tax=Roseitranquillus sediminis TaxID=2809051 RepID=UPI001D0CBB40|nr:circularly permuted type 2 ATP-grasp protein [Roseitranquillus sediminis]MBM9595670.1 circularly permuted type 2 ATP-grasp protein [Roseitranquillus sediminis]
MAVAAPEGDRLEGLLHGYRPVDGTPDELIGPDGKVRPVWSTLIEQIASASGDDLGRRAARADQYLRDAGVFFRSYDTRTAPERAWPLSHLPVLIHEREWRGIEAGLKQRADVLEALCADLYGPNRLVEEGHLPASLVGDNREWLRPLVGVRPRGGHFLHFVAFEIGRGPDGAWWVLGDRTQAPSGAGFALENRIATTRAFSDVYGQLNVHRLASFFRIFREALLGLRGDTPSRVAILTPGQGSDTYLEQAYIARYLGLMLLEGEDLAVRDGQLMVRTVSGLKPVSVIWRRLDANWCDPLELDESSQIGTAGLVQAIRGGCVTSVNALGAGVLETRAFLAFLPRIAEVLTGQPLRMPNIATWWCGGEAERAHVKANADAMTLSDARSNRLPFESDAPFDFGGFEGSGRAAWIDAEGPRLVAQEAVRLSSTPVLTRDGRIAPRPMSLRVFLARTPDGWHVMPGGFARIGTPGDPLVVAMRRGGQVADVWIVADERVPAETMLPTAADPFSRSQPGLLPSRAADNLTWMGRYVERAEALLRLLRAYHARLHDTGANEAPLVALIEEHLEEMGADASQTIPDALHDALAFAVGSASRVRDRFSPDGWTALTQLVAAANDAAETARPGDDAVRAIGDLLRRLSSFHGLVQDNMYRFIGWRFLGIGRALERGWTMAGALATFADPDAPPGGLDLAIELGDSVISHRRRYAVSTNRETVMDLLALDPLNPRSVLHQLDRIREHMDFLPGAAPHRQMTELQRAVLVAHTGLAVQTPAELDSAGLREVQRRIEGLADILSATYLK